MACGNHSGGGLGAIWGRLWAGLGFSRICCGAVLRLLGAVLGPSRTFLWPREEGFRSFGSISHLSESDRCEIDPKLLHGVPRILLMVSAAHVLPFALRLLLAKRVFALRGMMARVRVTPYRKVLADGSLFTVAVLCDVAYCLLYTSPSPRDRQKSRMPSSA